ncbi:Uncharacterised protein [Paenibacillus thiaminolyticus]|nr:Uncharacterised protein [Paenibacillus thiaminolyticus]
MVHVQQNIVKPVCRTYNFHAQQRRLTEIEWMYECCNNRMKLLFPRFTIVNGKLHFFVYSLYRLSVCHDEGSAQRIMTSDQLLQGRF